MNNNFLGVFYVIDDGLHARMTHFGMDVQQLEVKFVIIACILSSVTRNERKLWVHVLHVMKKNPLKY